MLFQNLDIHLSRGRVHVLSPLLGQAFVTAWINGML